MNLKSLESLPPGGWVYEQPETGMKFREMCPFGQIVKSILIHRTQNNLPRATVTEVGQDLEDATCLRLGGDEQWCLQKKTPVVASAGFPSSGPDALLAGVGSIKTGLQILADWWGDGLVPVSSHVANTRAAICRTCPENKPSYFFEKISEKVASAILEQMKQKNERGMDVEEEDKLQTCKVCRCHLPLKVWVPHATIMGRTPQEEFVKFPQHCWIVLESHKSPITPIQINEPNTNSSSVPSGGRTTGSSTSQVDSESRLF